MTLESSTFDVAKLKRDLVTIIKVVAEHYGVTVQDLLGRDRAEPLVTYRQVAMYLCRELTTGSFPDISRAFNKKNHMTVVHACHVVPNKALTDHELHIERLLRAAKSAIK
jgi:chromosomal replication initiator protein